jgi:hypothetical protein
LAPLWTTLKIIGGMLVSLAVIAAALFAGLTFAASQSVNNQLQGSNARISDPQDLGENCTFRVERAGLRVGGTATLYHNESLWLLVRPQHKPLFYVTTPDPIPLTSHESSLPQDFAQIRVASDRSRQELDFSAIPRANDLRAR